MTTGQGGQVPAEQLQDYTYAASGCFGLILLWLMNDCAEPPAALAARIADFTRPIRRK